MWVLTPERVGTPLSEPVSRPSIPDSPITQQPVFDAAKALNSARAEPESRIERDGSTFRVTVTKSDGRPGISFPAPAGGWSLSGLSAIEARVKNTGRHTLNVHLAIDGPGADRTHRKNCKIASERLSPGEEKTLTVPIAPVPPPPLEWLQGGKVRTYPYPEVAE